MRVKDRDYTVNVSVNMVTGTMHLFKYNDQQCVYEVFDCQSSGADWLDLPMPKLKPR